MIWVEFFGPEIETVFVMYGHVLHRLREHLNVPSSLKSWHYTVPKLILDSVVNELLYCLWLVYVSFCSLLSLVFIFFKTVFAY